MLQEHELEIIQRCMAFKQAAAKKRVGGRLTSGIPPIAATIQHFSPNWLNGIAAEETSGYRSSNASRIETTSD